MLQATGLFRFVVAAALAFACAACAGSREEFKLTDWDGARFRLRFPAGWALKTATDDTAVFDGTRAEGSFAVGRTLTVTRSNPAPTTEDVFASQCQNHLCKSRLVKTSGAYRLELTDTCPADSCPSEKAVEHELRKLWDAVAATVRER